MVLRHARWAVWLAAVLMSWPLTLAAAGPTKPYRHGEPTDAEQYMLELVNRARANPAAEARRAGIPLNKGLRPGTISPARKRPLAFHPRLITAARRHSQWMIDTGIFDHRGQGGSEPWDRMRRAGYRLTGSSAAGENISSYQSSSSSVSPLQQIRLEDTAQDIILSHHQGLFRSPGHRTNLLRPVFDEVGLGILEEWVEEGRTTPIYVSRATQKFARSGFTRLPFVLGVAYCDLNGNNFYDMGEGLKNVRVSVLGARQHALTTTSGGFAIPVAARGGRRLVDFTHGELSHAVTVRSRAGANAKADWRVPYAPPTISGPTDIASGLAARFTVSPVPAATSVDVVVQHQTAATKDSAEDLSRVDYETTGNYAPLSSAYRMDGSNAYHLRPAPFGKTEVLRYRDYFVPGPNATLRFESLLRTSSETLWATVEVSEDDGLTWTTLLYQSRSGPAESDFSPSVVRLQAYAGRLILLRFSLAESVANSPPPVFADSGWFIDEVLLEDVEVRSTVAVTSVGPDQTVAIQPPQPGQYLLTAIPRHYERSWPAGSSIAVTAR